MSELHESEKTTVVTNAQPQPALPEEKTPEGEKGQQVRSVADSAESSDRGQEPGQELQQQEGEQEKRPGQFKRLFAYMKTRDFWLLLLLG